MQSSIRRDCFTLAGFAEKDSFFTFFRKQGILFIRSGKKEENPPQPSFVKEVRKTPVLKLGV
jgi:hypothetical protein